MGIACIEYYIFRPSEPLRSAVVFREIATRSTRSRQFAPQFDAIEAGIMSFTVISPNNVFFVEAFIVQLCAFFFELKQNQTGDRTACDSNRD
jgi:hypothetical protein